MTQKLYFILIHQYIYIYIYIYIYSFIIVFISFYNSDDGMLNIDFNIRIRKLVIKYIMT